MKQTAIALFLSAMIVNALAQTREKGPWWPHAIWGANDQAGGSNWITPEKIMKALTYAKQGKVYELGHPYKRAMPMLGARSYKMSVVDTGPPTGKNKTLTNEEVITGELGQVGTQFDGPGHIGARLTFADGIERGVYYNGFRQEEVVNPNGLLNLGVHHIKPIISRGILIDVAGYKRMNRLMNSYEVTLADVKGALAKQGIDETSITPGDVLLFRYGWAQLWGSPQEYNRDQPGIGMEVAQWLIRKQVSMIGGDNAVTEVFPNPDPDLYGPVYQELIMKNGIFNRENMDLETLTADGVSPVKVNYIELEQANRVIGTTGESIALAYEKWRLIQAGKENLADKIEWVSQTQGDGLGFDILSRNTNGTDRYIEVKATKLTKEAPFYFSALEQDFSHRNRSNLFLYRVFNLKAEPKLFIANGAYDEFCNANPTQFKGTF